MRAIQIGFAVLFLGTAMAEEEKFLIFTDVFGQKTEARIVKVEGGQVVLEDRDGGSLQIPIKSLPESEKRMVREWIAKKKPAALPRMVSKPAAPSASPRQPDPKVKNKTTGRPLLPGETEFHQQFKKLEIEGKFAAAVSIGERWLAFCEQKGGANHPSTATCLSELGGLLIDLGRFDEAEPLLQRSLKIYQTELGPDHAWTLTATDKLAGVYDATGRIDQAIAMVEQVLEKRREKFGEIHPATANSLNNLAKVSQEAGRFDEAEQLFLRARKAYSQTLGSDHRSTMTATSGLAALYHEMARYREAAPLFKLVLENRVETFGPRHPEVGISLSNLGSTLSELGEEEPAMLLFERALEIFDANFEDNHPLTAATLLNLGGYYYGEFDYEKAEPFLRRALQIHEALLPPDHPDLAASLNNLGMIYKHLGRGEEAELLYERALRISEKKRGPHHPETLASLRNLTWLQIDQGRSDKAIVTARRALAAQDGLMNQILAFTGESERLDFRRRFSPFTLIANLEAAPEMANAVLRYKGIVLESLLEDRRVALSGKDPALASLVEEMTATKVIIRRARLEGSGDRAEQEALEARFREQEKRLARAVAGVGGLRDSLKLGWEDIAAVLPGDTALIEYFLYAKALGPDDAVAGFGAVVLRAGKEPIQVWCGSRDEIGESLMAFRQATIHVDEEGLAEASRALFDDLIKPVQPFLEDCGKLIVCPDSWLNFVPFAALTDEEGRFAAETFEIGYVAGGRDLKKNWAREASNPIVLVGAPRFRMEPRADLTSKGSTGGGERELRTRELDGLELNPLPASADEIRRIREILPKADSGMLQTLSQSDATESAVRKIVSPKVLHLATHGFFLRKINLGKENEETTIDQRMTFQGGENSPAAPPAIVNPMYRSGIALSGAQNTIEKWRRGEVPDPESDGILMAAEVGDLDLRGTDLVTLSACSTAVGGVLNGEGVLGLRRGFVMAGARNLLMTLWPVADEDTADFMEDFYTRYAETGDAPQSLAEVQREWLVRLREKRGLVHAVNRAGPFIMSSQGRLD